MSLNEQYAQIQDQLMKLNKHVFSGKPQNKGAKLQERKLRDSLQKIRYVLDPPKRKRY